MQWDKDIQQGMCSSQGYTVKGQDTWSICAPMCTLTLVGPGRGVWSGHITYYTKPAVAQDGIVADTCSLFQIKDSTCFETAIDCHYVGKAIQFARIFSRACALVRATR